MNGLFRKRTKYFKGPSLRPKKSRRTPDRDYTGGSEFSAQHIAVSADGRRAHNTTTSVQVDDEDDQCYFDMVMDSEGLFDTPDAVEFTCEDASADRVQVNKPHVVYVRDSIAFYLLAH